MTSVNLTNAGGVFFAGTSLACATQAVRSTYNAVTGTRTTSVMQRGLDGLLGSSQSVGSQQARQLFEASCWAAAAVGSAAVAAMALSGSESATDSASTGAAGAAGTAGAVGTGSSSWLSSATNGTKTFAASTLEFLTERPRFVAGVLSAAVGAALLKKSPVMSWIGALVTKAVTLPTTWAGRKGGKGESAQDIGDGSTAQSDVKEYAVVGGKLVPIGGRPVAAADHLPAQGGALSAQPGAPSTRGGAASIASGDAASSDVDDDENGGGAPSTQGNAWWRRINPFGSKKTAAPTDPTPAAYPAQEQAAHLQQGGLSGQGGTRNFVEVDPQLGGPSTEVGQFPSEMPPERGPYEQLGGAQAAKDLSSTQEPSGGGHEGGPMGTRDRANSDSAGQKSTSTVSDDDE